MATGRTGLGLAAATNGKLYAVGGFYSGSLATVEQYDPSTNSWTNRAPMLTARYSLGVAAASNGKVYAVGGTNNGNLATVEEYDPTTDSWTTRAPMLTARSALGLAAASNGRLYAVGGFNNGNLATVEEYDPTTDTWTTRAPMPTARGYVGLAAASNGKLYAVGGLNSGGAGALATVEEYAPTTDSWFTRDPMPTPRYNLGLATNSNGRLDAVGGWDGRHLETVEEYDPAAGSAATTATPTPTATPSHTATSVTVATGWAARAPMPTGRYGLGLATGSNGKLYAVGGYNSSGYLPTVEEYDPATNTWTTRAPMPTARSGLGLAAASNGKLYAIGGNNYRDLATVEEYDPTSDSWTTRAPMPTARGSIGAAASNGKLYAVGGNNTTGPLAMVEEYDPMTNSWTTRASMPTARFALGVAARNGKLYAIGGYGYAGSLATVEEYDPNTDSWIAYSNMPTARHGLGLASALNGKLYAIGGSEGANAYLATVEELDPTAVAVATVTVTRTPTRTPTPTRTHTPALTRTPPPDSPGWTTRANMPTGRRYLGLAATGDGKLYAVGGQGQGGYLATLDRYDPTSNTWTPRASMATGRTNLSLVTGTNGKLYAIGGYGSSGYSQQHPNAVEEYDPTTDTWVARASMPTGRIDMGLAAAANGKLYAVGGGSPNAGGGLTVATVEEYDPSTDTWTTRARMPTARSGLGLAAAPNGRLYAVGGQVAGVYLTTVEEYDPTTDTWTTRASMPTERSGLGLATARGKLYAIGGISNRGILDAVEEYDPTTDRWTSLAHMPTARFGLGVATSANGKVYAVGGRDGYYEYLTTVEELDPTIVPTATPASAQSTSTRTATASMSASATSTATAGSTTSPAASETLTATPTPTATATATHTAAPTVSETPTSTGTGTATRTATVAATETPTATPTLTATSTVTRTATVAASSTSIDTPTSTVTRTATGTDTPTRTATSTLTHTATVAASSTSTNTAAPTATNTRTPTATVAMFATSTGTATQRAAETPTATATSTETTTAAPTRTPTPTSTRPALGESTSTPTLTVLPSLAPVVSQVEPASGATTARTSLRISGVNIRAGADVFLVRASTSFGLDGVTVRDGATIEAQVPSGLPVGSYDVLVINLDGTEGRLPGGYSVTSAGPVLRSVLPSQGSQDIPTDLVLLGANFAEGMTGRIEAGGVSQALGTIRVTSAGRARAAVPSGVPAGTYAVVLRGSGGDESRLSDAFTILLPTGNALDLSLTGGDIWLDGAARVDGSVRLGANITRRGGTSSVSVPVAFYLGDPAAGGTQLGSTTSAPIGLQSEPEPVSIAWTPAAQGSQVVYAVLDPASTLGEPNRVNNVASRTITVLPPAADTTPPVLSGLVLAGGAATTSGRSVTVELSARDPEPGSGVRSMLVIEREFSPSARAWIAVREPVWQPFAASSSYELTETPGVHYVQAWVADGAGNISLEVVRAAVSYEPAQDSLLGNQRRLYRRTLAVGETLTASVVPLAGDPDLYVWGPDGARLALSNAAGSATEEASVSAAVAGVYQVEVYAYTDTTYSLTLRVQPAGTSAARRAQAIDPSKTALRAPLVGATDAPAGQTGLPPAPVAASQLEPTATPTTTPTVGPRHIYLPIAPLTMPSGGW